MPAAPPSVSRMIHKISPPGASSASSHTSNQLDGIAKGNSGLGGNRAVMETPDVFRTLSDRDKPENLQGAFEICKHLSKWSTVHKAYVVTMSTFPVTQFKVLANSPSSDSVTEAANTRHEQPDSRVDPAVRRVQRLFDRHWRVRKFAQKLGRSYWTYNNAPVTISFPFIKRLTCKNCGHAEAASGATWTIEGGKFKLTCSKCSHVGIADANDHWTDQAEGVRPVLLDVPRTTVLENELTGQQDVYYRISQSTIDRVRDNNYADREFIISLPQPYLEAAFKSGLSGDQKDAIVKIRSDLFYLMQTPALPEEDHGMSFPDMTASFPEFWLRSLFRKAQESLASDFIIPARAVYPEASRTSGNLFEMVNVSSYLQILRKELQMQKRDPNYTMALPFPIGQQTLGGEMKPLSVAQDIRILMESECAALTTPLEFIFGGLSYSGSNVSIKQQESKIEDFREELQHFSEWFYETVSKHIPLPRVTIEQTPFRMGEDLQMMQMLTTLHAQQLASLKRLHEEAGWDTNLERAEILSDVEFKGELAGKMMDNETKKGRESMVQQAKGQASGQVAGLGEMVAARAKLVSRIRNDAELLPIVMSDPGLAQGIFGANSPEVRSLHAPTEQPQVPDPEQVAPKAKEQPVNFNIIRDGGPGVGKLKQEHQMSPDHVRAAMSAELGLEVPGDRSSIVSRLVSGFRDLPREQWSEILTHIGSNFGSEVQQEVVGHLMQAVMQADEMPEHLPARREQ